MEMKILIVEDDQATSLGLNEILTQQNYTVNLVTDGQKALEFASQFEYDLIVLDIIIPKIDGISVCKHLRNSGYQNPILLLTAKNASDDRVMGLDAGADDYVVKPFDLPEFLARIRALLRRGKSVMTVTIWENLQLDTVNSEVTCNGQRIHFTPKEYCLLELFFLNPKRIYNRTTILDKLWDFADSPGEETVSTHIKCLRQKLKAAGASDPIETVHGLGYRLRQESTAKTEYMPESTKANKTLELTSNIKNKTLKIWDKYQNIISQQVTILEEAVQALITSSITSEVRQKAKDEAHKLAGSLGLFGLKHGSLLARDLENLLQVNINLEQLQVQQIIEKIKLLRLELNNAEITLKTANESSNNFPLILIVDDDLFLADQVRVEAINWGMRVEVATDLNIARKIISQTPPDVILLDLNFPSTQEHGLNLLHDLATQNPNISIIAFTGSQSLADRVEVARLGGCAFLHKPLPAYKIFNAIIEALNKKQLTKGARILLVDDDILVLECLSNHLRDLGAEVETLKNSNQFWEVLTTFKPNLLVLDLKMPDFDGIQLCQAVRTDPYWQHLPVVFVCNNTTQTEIDTCLGAGANDYISKSTNSDEIANRIFRHLQHGTLQQIAYREDLVTKKGK